MRTGKGKDYFMKEKIPMETHLQRFRIKLMQEEKSALTLEKYGRDIQTFLDFLKEGELTKERVMEYKSMLLERGYAVSSINSMLSALNRFLAFLGREDCRVRNLKMQRQIYSEEKRELTRADYGRLLKAAEKDRRLRLILETLGATGIRISELAAFRVEAVRTGTVLVNCKGKLRKILLPGKLRKELLRYARERGIRKGRIFCTRTGRAMDRSNIWAQMKRLSKKAGVSRTKIFPHNFRKLFARSFYALERDIAKLADVLGHSSIDTTRIYIMSTGQEHRQRIERLGLVP